LGKAKRKPNVFKALKDMLAHWGGLDRMQRNQGAGAKKLGNAPRDKSRACETDSQIFNKASAPACRGASQLVTMEHEMTDRRHAKLAQDTPEAMLKMVLDREAATAARHDDRIKELKAQHQEAFQKDVDANEARIDAEAKLAQQDDLMQAAVAAALRDAAGEAAGEIAALGERELSPFIRRRILALITPDAQAALDRVVAAERERCAKVAESLALPMDGKIAKAQAGYMRGIIANNIRKAGE
jgi:hypothetical protein